MSNILLILQLAVSLLVSVQTNPNIPVEQKNQALSFAIQATQMAQSYLASTTPVENTVVAPESLLAPLNTIQITMPSQPQVESNTPSVELSITANSQGSRNVYDVKATGDNIKLEAVVVGIKDKADRETFYPNDGVLVGKEGVGIVARLQAKECQAVKPSYVCPGKEIETSEQYQAIQEMGYHNVETYLLNQGESYFFEIPESARIIYVKATGQKSGQAIEQTF